MSATPAPAPPDPTDRTDRTDPTGRADVSDRAVRAGATARTRLVLTWVRRFVLLYAVGGFLYLAWRFDVQTLPAGGISPLTAFRPGAHLLVDRSAEGEVGAALLYRDDQGRLLLGRAAQKPADERRPGLWILSDPAEGVLPDSRTLGPIPSARIEGRVVCAIPGFD